jgi:hypothetical protein
MKEDMGGFDYAKWANDIRSESEIAQEVQETS